MLHFSKNVLFSVYLKGDIAKGVKDLTTPYKELVDTNAPLVTIMLGDMQLQDIQRFAQTLAENQIKSNPHIWLISEQFLLAYIDLYGRFPEYKNQKFICYYSPPRFHSEQHTPGCSNCTVAQNVSLALNLPYFIELGVEQIVMQLGQNEMVTRNGSSSLRGESDVGSPHRGKSDNVELLYLDSDERTLIKLAWTKQSLSNDT